MGGEVGGGGAPAPVSIYRICSGVEMGRAKNKSLNLRGIISDGRRKTVTCRRDFCLPGRDCFRLSTAWTH